MSKDDNKKWKTHIRAHIRNMALEFRAFQIAIGDLSRDAPRSSQWSIESDRERDSA